MATGGVLSKAVLTTGYCVLFQILTYQVEGKAALRYDRLYFSQFLAKVRFPLGMIMSSCVKINLSFDFTGKWIKIWEVSFNFVYQEKLQ